MKTVQGYIDTIKEEGEEQSPRSSSGLGRPVFTREIMDSNSIRGTQENMNWNFDIKCTEAQVGDRTIRRLSAI